MVNPTHIYPPSTEPGPFNLSRHARIGLHEKADGTFVNASPNSPVPVSIYGDGGSLVIDGEHGALLTMSLEQYMVHQGKAFVFTSQFTLAAGATVDFMGVTGPTSDVHFRNYDVTSLTGPVDTFLYEGTTYSAAGTPASAVNLNRTSINTPTISIYGSPTVTSIGTLLSTATSTAGGNKTGDTTGGLPVEWILRPDTAYTLRVHNIDQQDADMTAVMFFYEP
jgi:hypothetical protein